MSSNLMLSGLGDIVFESTLFRRWRAIIRKPGEKSGLAVRLKVRVSLRVFVRKSLSHLKGEGEGSSPLVFHDFPRIECTRLAE